MFCGKIFIITVYLLTRCVSAVDDFYQPNTLNTVYMKNIISDFQKSMISNNNSEQSSLNEIPARETHDILDRAKYDELNGLGYYCTYDIGWHKLHITPEIWNHARKSCEQENAHLAVINSDAEAEVSYKKTFHLVYVNKEKP